MIYVDWYGVDLYSVSSEIQNWLLSHMGKPGISYTIRGNTVYFFKETDRLIFLLNFE